MCCSSTLSSVAWSGSAVKATAVCIFCFRLNTIFTHNRCSTKKQGIPQKNQCYGVSQNEIWKFRRCCISSRFVQRLRSAIGRSAATMIGDRRAIGTSSSWTRRGISLNGAVNRYDGVCLGLSDRSLLPPVWCCEDLSFLSNSLLESSTFI